MNLYIAVVDDQEISFDALEIIYGLKCVLMHSFALHHVIFQHVLFSVFHLLQLHQMVCFHYISINWAKPFI
jgi:hypothetical protein